MIGSWGSNEQEHYKSLPLKTVTTLKIYTLLYETQMIVVSSQV